MKTVRVLEWSQMLTGCTAALIVSLNLGNTWIFYAMVLFIIKDSMMAAFAYIQRYPGIITSSLVYIVIDAVGIYRWWIW